MSHACFTQKPQLIFEGFPQDDSYLAILKFTTSVMQLGGICSFIPAEIEGVDPGAHFPVPT